MNTTRISALALTAVLGLGLTGCTVTGTAAEGAAPSTSATTSTGGVTVEDPWVKAAATGGMTAVFGIVHNDSDTARTLVKAATTVSPEVQLHQTSADASGKMIMSEVDGGFPIDAHGSFTLEPGGNHIMLMGLTADLAAGDEIPVTLTFDDGSTVEITAPVKDFSGAKEDYGDMEGSDEHGGHGEDHEGH